MTDCAVCGRSIRPLDGVVAQRISGDLDLIDADDPLEAAGDRWWVHIGCTKDGVERWCRAGRPSEDPVAWCRSAGLNWTGLQGQAVRGRAILPP